MADVPSSTKAQRLRELNETIRYTMWSVFRFDRSMLPLSSSRSMSIAELVAEVDELFTDLSKVNVVVRGTYDLAGLRADADLMVWWHAPEAEALQQAHHRLSNTALGQAWQPVWSAMALHRPAEFNKSHIPAFLSGEEPLDWVCVYPFVRSYEWYLLPDAERREMLAEHGKMAREYPDVHTNTVAAFALGDYEWMLAFEAQELHRIVDLMRHLRASAARRHVRLEIPFFTGRRRPIADIVAS